MYERLLLNERQIQQVLQEYDAALGRWPRFHAFHGIWRKLKFEFSEAARLLDQTLLQGAVRDLSDQAARSRGVTTDELRLQQASAMINRRQLEQRLGSTDALVQSTLTHVSSEMTRSSNEIKRFSFQNGPSGTGAALDAEFRAVGLSSPRFMSHPTSSRSNADSSSLELIAILVWRVLILFGYLIVLPAEVSKLVDNKIELETAHGEIRRVPWEYWQSPGTLHGFLLWHFRNNSAREDVRAESYALFQGGPNGPMVDSECWTKVKRRMKLTQVLLVGGSFETCPRCASMFPSQAGAWLSWYVVNTEVRNRANALSSMVCRVAFPIGSDLIARPMSRAHLMGVKTRPTIDRYHVPIPSPVIPSHNAVETHRDDLSQIVHIILTAPPIGASSL